ncbi:MAG: hypothetical protein BroJett003_04980 [Planctomycetota bacterium]|nr:MAG: hypothetical protein BroJett003_04980 [Planctomycetota bacterium]
MKPHRSVESLEKAIPDYIQPRNKNPMPFTWTADPADMLTGVMRPLKP